MSYLSAMATGSRTHITLLHPLAGRPMAYDTR